MTLRTVTSPSITDLHGAARGGDTVVFTLLAGTYSATEHVPQDRQAVTIADDGSLSVVLYCPARYHCTIAGAMSFYFTLPDSTAPTTLESLHASSAAAPDATNELQTMIDALTPALLGAEPTQAGAAVSSRVLKEWTTAEAYDVTAVTYSGTATSTVASATVVWPDDSAGVFTATTINATFETIDAYTVTHAVSGKTVTQAAVTRNTDGLITSKPALGVA
jgi:hypothetical protein